MDFMIRSKKELAVKLSKLKQIITVDRKLEQYQTDSELAADMLWNAYMEGDIDGKKVFDLGCGNGILGIGALMLAAKEAVFVEKDNKAIEILKDNLDSVEIDSKVQIMLEDIKNIEFVNEKAEDCVVVMNPPFGTKQKHTDKVFLEKAFSFADVCYSLHKAETKQFIEAFTKDNQYVLDRQWQYEFGIKKSHAKHKKKVYSVKVILTKLMKMKNINSHDAHRSSTNLS